jgi:hypothetical protein
MSAARRLGVLLFAAAGAVASSQAPEFAQQYRQRLGGALDEVRQVVADFDADARRNELTREQALRSFRTSDQGFLRDRGASITRVIARQERLAEQQARLESTPPLMRPVVVLSAPDRQVVAGAWSIYEPALPVTPAGLAWAALGFLLFAGTVSVMRQLTAIARRRRRRLEPRF